MQGRSVMVTGGGSGIGAGVAAELAAAGATVTIVGRNAERLDRVADTLGDGVRAHSADVTDEDQIADAVAAAVDHGGRLDGVVACAGGNETIGPIAQLDTAAWRRTVELNLTGTMLTIKHAAPRLVDAGGGSFVGISSIAASNTHRWFGAYGPSKLGMEMLLKGAADELGASRVRVNGIRPGLTRTDLVELITAGGPLLEDYRESTPLPRVGEVEDIAALAAFLLSDASSWITGQIINVDGGQSLRRGPDFTSMLEPAFGADGLRGVVPE
ncbi:SDR family oxidoreductase [Gordonia shandongensis]|uniref:SDR family oxidoreductase n=1 Tax=Gordonia shandongensis TaxID=376351 RepID=UPI00041633DC|nr:SDR family oxidoreductase [Gordonia shandongensis]